VNDDRRLGEKRFGAHACAEIPPTRETSHMDLATLAFDAQENAFRMLDTSVKRHAVAAPGCPELRIGIRRVPS
jgi:hypothetical protein